MIVKRFGFAIGIAIFILGTALATKYAQRAGAIDPDNAKRIVQVLIGLVLAAYANVMPKQLRRPRRSALAEARVQAALRAGGWSMTLAGLAYAGLWALAPLPFADDAGTAAIAIAMAVTLGYALWSFAACRDAGRAPAGR